MKHLYTNYCYTYVEESEEDCVKSLEYDNDTKTEKSDWCQWDDNRDFYIDFRSKKNGHIDKGDIAIPKVHSRGKIREDDCEDDFNWFVCAKAKNWAEANKKGFLCCERD